MRFGLHDKMKVPPGNVNILWWLLVMISCKMIVIETAPNVQRTKRTTWSAMKNYDFWNTEESDNGLSDDKEQSYSFEHYQSAIHALPDVVDSTKKNKSNNRIGGPSTGEKRQNRVLHLFPVPVDGECVSDDGRRTGVCFNAYECRLKGGISKGQCAMGFGVCCIFIASCNQIISNNITYLVSPNFPSFMPSNVSSCKVQVKILNEDISQLRIDFYHFSLGQPNRRTGFCDGDVFNVTGGPAGSFLLCGQNSGQHIYYDVGGRNFARQTLYGSLRPLTYSMLYPNQSSNIEINESEIEILMSFSTRFVPTRFWEIRITQIPFSQRAPAGCLQYFTTAQGIIQTFNFADNGRHLANQHYRVCMRQEMQKCSITYQPCDDQSFRIGPNMQSEVEFQTESIFVTSDLNADVSSAMTTTQSPTRSTAAVAVQNSPLSSSNAPMMTLLTQSSTPAVSSVSGSDETNNNEIDGSGGGSLPQITSRRPFSGGFNIFSLFRSAFDFRQQRNSQHSQSSSRQFFTTCTDRITMPCIIEDFIGVGLGPLPGCEPVHCGNRFCSTGNIPCRIESTVTPFYIGVHFGDGQGKGSPEDNIGACIRYTQVECL